MVIIIATVTVVITTVLLIIGLSEVLESEQINNNENK